MDLPVEIFQFFFLFFAALVAGGVDAMVGGGGLVQLPSLLVTFPQAPLSVLFGTNKLGSAVGTFFATLRYLKEVVPPVRMGMVSAISSFFGSYVGANFVAYINPIVMRPIVLVLLVAVAIYTVCKPNFGFQAERKLEEVPWLLLKASLLSLCIGFYDGFFGPGTGTFFLFGFVVLFRLDFITASVLSKIANLSTNCAALFFFLPSGYVVWKVGAVLALGNLVGSLIGSSLAVKKGTHFIRLVFLGVVTLLTARLSFLWFW